MLLIREKFFISFFLLFDTVRSSSPVKSPLHGKSSPLLTPAVSPVKSLWLPLRVRIFYVVNAGKFLDIVYS